MDSLECIHTDNTAANLAQRSCLVKSLICYDKHCKLLPCARVDKTSAFTSIMSVYAVHTLQQLLRHHRTMQGGIAGEDSHQAGEVGQHSPAVLGAAAGPASAECGAGRPHWPCKSSSHGDPHAGKFAASCWVAGLLAKALVLC